LPDRTFLLCEPIIVTFCPIKVPETLLSSSNGYVHNGDFQGKIVLLVRCLPYISIRPFIQKLSIPNLPIRKSDSLFYAFNPYETSTRLPFPRRFLPRSKRLRPLHRLSTLWRIPNYSSTNYDG
jgi:hypothetical protein